jgi:phosphatidylinositol alpha-1,6-mannosyltransferase
VTLPSTSEHLLLTYDFPPLPGGIARMMGELARRYPPGTLTVSTGQCRGAGEVDHLLPNRVDRISVQSRRLRTVQGLLAWSYRAAKLARTLEPEFVWCGNFKPASYPARWLFHRFGAPYGIFLYGTDLLLLQHQIRSSAAKRRAAQALLGRAAVLLPISRWTRDLCLSLLSELGFEDDKKDVRVLTLGTDPRHFRPGLDSEAVRRRYHLEPGRWLITVARLVGHKGVDTVIRALAALRLEQPELRYMVVGSGAKQGELEALAQTLGVSDRVRFLTNVPDADLPALYNHAEIYLGLSRPAGLMMEGFGISLCEASACGIPVIGGSNGGIPDAVRHGETGLLVDALRIEPAVEAIRLLLANRELAQRLGTGGRKAVESFYNWDRVTADVRRIGRELSSSVSRRRSYAAESSGRTLMA